MCPSMITVLKIRITGLVQGVNFRREAQRVARKLELTGYARNNLDGSVSICAQGSHEALQKLLHWCHHGPEEALVKTVSIEKQQEIDQSYPDFTIQ